MDRDVIPEYWENEMEFDEIYIEKIWNGGVFIHRNTYGQGLICLVLYPYIYIGQRL
jgi:hypothetical protein